MTHDASEIVYILHGLGANRLLMGTLAARIARHGYRVINWGYASWQRNVEHHAARFARELTRADADASVSRINVVAHSMGGIVTRQALLYGVPRKFGRFVMVAPPNKGSRVGKVFAPYLGRLCPPITQLSTLPDSYVNRLPPPEGVEFGVIAGERDLMVGPGCTRLDGMADHTEFPCMHTSLIFRRDVADAISRFLEDGKFNGKPSA